MRLKYTQVWKVFRWFRCLWKWYVWVISLCSSHWVQPRELAGSLLLAPVVLYVYDCIVSPILIVLLNTNCKLRCRSPTLNVNPVLFVIPYNYLEGLTKLQCCKYYHLPSKIMPKLLHAFYCQNLVHITLICNMRGFIFIGGQTFTCVYWHGVT